MILRLISIFAKFAYTWSKFEKDAMTHQPLNIAIGLICHQAKILVGWRFAQQHQGNKHEFPGGKCQAHELPIAACRREIQEEVGVDIADWRSLGCDEFDYGDVFLRLHWFQANLPSNSLQKIPPIWHWFEREALLNLTFPKANQMILQRLQWPRELKITPCLSDVQTQHALLYWRPKIEFSALQLSQQLSDLNASELSRIMLNHALWIQLPKHLQQHIHTVHLKHQQVMALNAADLNPTLRYVAACHNAASLHKAQQLGCDAILLSPVHATKSHPQATVLGWGGFSALAVQCDVPVYALGGLSKVDLIAAKSYGAYGVAGISKF